MQLLQVNSVVVAGHDTTSFCLTSTLYHVAQHPAVKQKLFAELDRLGRDTHITAADLERLPYLEVCSALAGSWRLWRMRKGVQAACLAGVRLPES